MPTVKLKATKMSDAKVSFISLVERGANRIPFKIVKQEKSMTGKAAFAGLDLSHLFTRKAETQPEKVEVVGVVTMKDGNYDSIKSQLEEQGVKVSDAVEMGDGSVVFKQVEGDLDGEGTVVRVSEHVALITKGFKPYAMDMEVGEQTFADMVKTQGFYPGIGTVMEVLRGSIMGVVGHADDPAKASKAVGSMFDEAKAYVSSMVGSLPSVAFKSEAIEPKVVVKAEEDGKKEAAVTAQVGETTETNVTDVAVEKGFPKKKMTPEEQAAADKEAADMAAGAAEEKAPDVEDKKMPPTKKVDEALTSDEVSAMVVTKVTESMDALAKKMEDMFSILSGKVTTSLQEIDGKVAKAEQVAKSASDKVTGIVVVGGDTDDHDKVQKNDRVGFGGRDIDTAFMPRAIRKAAGR